jgi:hypothetical protein
MQTGEGNIHFVKETFIFRGQAGNPFLAPRGVCLVKNHLIVADTGQNRVFIWKKLPRTEFAEPDVVLGQPAQTGTGRNSGGLASAGTLQYPSGIWSDGEKLIVADAWNHRVLIWHALPKANGQPADVVVGQPDFEQNQPNVSGVNHEPSAQSLYWCYGVFSDGKSLWIADTGNRRILYFKEIPKENFPRADGVIGQKSFMEREYDPWNAIWPYSVKISPKGEMLVADTQYYRVLYWQHFQKTFDNQADIVFGQADFESNGQNQYSFSPKANTLNWCYDAVFYKNGLLIADTGNSRILQWNEILMQNNVPANRLFGQDNFEKGIENKNLNHTTEDSLYWAFAVSADENLLAIADTGNHRVVLAKMKS